MNGTQISPAAVLAAVLYNLGEKVKTKIKMSDKDEERELEVPVVEVKREGDTVMCILPLPKVIHFAATVYNMHFTTVKRADCDDLLAVIGFEKQAKTPTIVGLNGQSLTGSNEFKKMFSTLFSKETPK